MRTGLTTWVRAYISHEKGRAEALVGYSDKNLQDLLSEYCRSRPADNIQLAADAIERELAARQAGPPPKQP